MIGRPLLGIAECLLCRYPRAEVRQGNGGTAYQHCSKCTTTVRTGSRDGDLLLRKLVQCAAPPVAADPLAIPDDAAASSPTTRRTAAHRRARR